MPDVRICLRVLAACLHLSISRPTLAFCARTSLIKGGLWPLLMCLLELVILTSLLLAIADGFPYGKADPAFAAHYDPVASWAEAVWFSWLSLHVLVGGSGARK